MLFELLISTMHKDAEQVLEMLRASSISCHTLVVVQGDIDDYTEFKNNNQNIRILFSKERGLSKSRNLALKNCKADYGYIMDDDVVLEKGAIEKIVTKIVGDCADVGTSYFKYEDGHFSKSNLSKKFKHDLFTVAKVASIEMCVKIDSVKKNNIYFNEAFGLGTDLPSGEEYMFLTDCLKKKLHIYHYPICIGTHPNIISGDDFYSSSEKILAKREMLKYVFLWKSPLFIFAFWIKKLPHVIRANYALKFTRTLILGIK